MPATVPNTRRVPGTYGLGGILETIRIESLREICRTDKIKWTLHALKRIRERKILSNTVIDAILQGEAIVHYRDDKPFPSYLIFNGDSTSPLHVVASADADTVYIVTAYIPTLEEWENDYKTRKGQ